MKTFLHVGCGQNRKDKTTACFAGDGWRELRFDIDPQVRPDIIGTMLDMSAIQDASMDAVYSSHNIEHLYPHEVPKAFAEFLRILKPDGFLVITCPDLQSVAALIADDKLTDTAYVSKAGPISPIDIVYGFREAMARGNLFMAHRCGFTKKVLMKTLQSSGFASLIGMGRSSPKFDLWVAATKIEWEESALRRLAFEHFPG